MNVNVTTEGNEENLTLNSSNSTAQYTVTISRSKSSGKAANTTVEKQLTAFIDFSIFM